MHYIIKFQIKNRHNKTLLNQTGGLVLFFNMKYFFCLFNLFFCRGLIAFERIFDIGKDMWIRRVLVPNLTNDDNELNNLYSFISSLKTVKKVEILPYHTLGIFSVSGAKIEAKAGEDGSWQDVTGSGSITITGNQTVYVRDRW